MGDPASKINAPGEIQTLTAPRRRSTPCPMIRTIALSIATLALLVQAHAACGPEALGTSRGMIVDPAKTPRVGLKSFAETLPLADREVVLTFDDGPHPPTTRPILAALARECVRATFFL